ncbi:MAG: galactokinase [Bacteroidota bacterium]|jgi:galactokinase
MKNELTRLFIEQFQASPQVIVRSPGRVNIIGEHADYNNGFVLPAAIDKAAYIAISLRADDEFHLSAIAHLLSEIKPALKATMNLPLIFISHPYKRN